MRPHGTVGLLTALCLGCGGAPDRAPATAADTAMAPEPLGVDGVLLASAVVGPAGGILTVGDAAGYSGATVTFAPGVFADPTRVELLLISSPGEVTEAVPLLALVAGAAFDGRGVEVSVPRVDPVLGAPPEDLALFAYARGTGDFVRLTDEDAKRDGAVDWLKAKLDAAYDAAVKAVSGGLDVVGMTVESAGESVAKGSHGVSEGLPLSLDGALASALSGGKAILLAKTTEPLYRLLLQPRQLVAHGTATLADVVCGGPKRALVVHGVLSHYSAFEGPSDLLEGLAAKGWTLGKLAYPSGRHIAENGAALAALVQAARQGCPSIEAPKELNAIGHSMGGLVLRFMVQDHGAQAWLRRLVMLATPNGGGDHPGGLIDLGDTEAVDWLAWLATLDPKLGLAVLQKAAPGLFADLLKQSGALQKLDATLGDHAADYFVLAGWGKNALTLWQRTEGLEATDGAVEIASALALDLPKGHERYFSLVGGKPTMTAYSHGFSSPHAWKGAPDQQFGHAALHEQATQNGVRDAVVELLTAGDCFDLCEDLACGLDTCGADCGACPLGFDCDLGQCVVCVPACSGVVCGDSDGCGGACADGSGCTTAPFTDPGDTATTDVSLLVKQVAADPSGKVKLFASVQTQSGEPIAQLTIGNFALTEAIGTASTSVPIESLEVAEETEEGMSAVLVLDSSGSMTTDTTPTSLELAKAAAKDFVSYMKAADQVAIVDFSSTVVVRQPLTNDKLALFDAIDQVGLGEATAMFDGIEVGLDLLDGLGGQRALVVLTDGADNSSSIAASDVIAHAVALSVPIYGIGLGIDPSGGYEDTLVALSQQTNAGGKGLGYFASPSPGQLKALYEKIALILKKTYVIGWFTTGQSGETVQVTLTATYQSAAGKLSDSFSAAYLVP